jgi:Holliday junction resolvase-like predicted endonuclease
MIAPCQAVSKAKQIKIIKTALMYFSENKMKLQPRFDVIEVFTERGSKAVIKAINHIENAFSAEGYDAFI